MRHMCYAIVLTFAALAIAAGCVSHSRDERDEYPTSIATYNERDDEIWIEEFWYADHNWTGGIHRPGIWSDSGPIFPPYPDTARFRWFDSEKREHVQTVKFEPPPGDFRGTIYFRFQPDNSIKVSIVTHKERREATDGPYAWRRASTQPASRAAREGD